MQKIIFSHIFLYGLYLFIKQIELSVDRALHNHWKELVLFFNERKSVKKVINRFQEVSGGAINLTKSENCYIKNTNKWYLNIKRKLFKTPSLNEDELRYIHYILIKFKEHLKSNEIPSPDELIELRMKCYDAREIIEPILNKNELFKAKSIIHLNHSDFIQVFELEEIIGSAWP